MKRFMVVYEMGDGGAVFTDSYSKAKQYMMDLACGCGACCAQLYQWNIVEDRYEFLED